MMMAASEEAKKEMPWEEEKRQMGEVIKKQIELIGVLTKQNTTLKTLAEQQDKRIKEISLPVDKLEEEFKVCSEDIRFADVGGLGPVVDRIRYFQNGIIYPELYEAYAIRPPRGLLLHGPPGCGKTLLAKAISNELDCYFLEVPITRVISKWVGEAERTLEAMLKKCNDIYLEKGIKVLVFVDEAEQMFRKRGSSGDHGVIDRCVNVWLRYMDGMADGEGLIYVAATNQPDLLDDAVKRAGRFDHIVEIPLPDRQGVEEILRKQVAYKERRAKRSIYMVDDYGRLADMLFKIGVNGADIAEVLRITSEKQIRRMIDLSNGQEVSRMVKHDRYVYQHQLEQTIAEYASVVRKPKEKRIGFNV